MRALRSLLPLAASLLATPLPAQILRGKVLDAATGAAVPAAAVRALVGGRDVGHARTRADGTFSFQLRVPGTVRIEAQRTGYRATVTGDLPVGLRETVDVEVKLSAEAITIEPLRVTARVAPPRRRSLELNGVYERERRGFGRRLLEDIARHSNMNLGQVRSRVNGTRLVRAGRSEYIVLTRASTTFALVPGRQGCLSRLYLDGARVAYGGGMDINSLVSPEMVEAVELYASAAQIPAEYNGMESGCGVILIRTRMEP